MSRILLVAVVSLSFVIFLVPADGQDIPEICTMCYEGEMGGEFVHAFDDEWNDLQGVTPMTNGVHINSAYPGGCAGGEHAHMCCEPT